MSSTFMSRWTKLTNLTLKNIRIATSNTNFTSVIVSPRIRNSSTIKHLNKTSDSIRDNPTTNMAKTIRNLQLITFLTCTLKIKIVCTKSPRTAWSHWGRQPTDWSWSLWSTSVPCGKTSSNLRTGWLSKSETSTTETCSTYSKISSTLIIHPTVALFSLLARPQTISDHGRVSARKKWRFIKRFLFFVA